MASLIYLLTILLVLTMLTKFPPIRAVLCRSPSHCLTAWCWFCVHPCWSPVAGPWVGRPVLVFFCCMRLLWPLDGYLRTTALPWVFSLQGVRIRLDLQPVHTRCICRYVFLKPTPTVNFSLDRPSRWCYEFRADAQFWELGPGQQPNYYFRVMDQ